MHRYSLFLFLFFTAFQLKAQLLIDPVFQHLPAEKLGVNNVYQQLWDKKGMMWVASDKGLVCYNGYSAELWSHQPHNKNSLLENKIQTMFLDSRGWFWIAYANQPGLTKFEPGKRKFTHFFPDSTRKDAFPVTVVTGIHEDRKNRMWITTWDAGLIRLDPLTGKCKIYKPHPDKKSHASFIPHARIKGFCERRDGKFMIGFFDEGKEEAQPVVFDAEKETFTKFNVKEFLLTADKKEAEHINSAITITHCIYQDDYDNIWFGTYSGLVFFDMKNKKAQRVSGMKVESGRNNLDNTRRIIADEKGLLWCGTPQAGILVVDPRTLEAGYIKHTLKNSLGLGDNRVGSMRKDPDGNIWISSPVTGFSIYNPLMQQFIVLPWEEMGVEYTNRSLQAAPVNQMMVHKNGDLYVSSESGISVYDGKTRKVKQKIDPKGKLNANSVEFASRVQNFKLLDDENILFISPGTPALYNTRTGKFKRIPTSTDRIFRILFRHRQEPQPLVLVRDWYLKFFDYNFEKNQMEIFMRFDSTGENAVGMMSDAYSLITGSGKWIFQTAGTDFIIYDPVQKSYARYGPGEKVNYFPDSTINVGFADNDHNIWFATENGLYHFDEHTGKSKLMNKALGIDNIPVKAITRDKHGIYWIALERHILRWDRAAGKSFIYRTEMGLNIGSFLPSIAQTDEHGIIHIASVNGVLRFDPEKLKLPEAKPKLFLASMNIGEDTLDEGRMKEFISGGIKLGHAENFLNMEFYTSQLYTPLPHHFFYRLIGLDKNWQENGTSNVIKYTNLSPGDYLLEVKVRNSYGIESDVLRIPFTITNPFWKSAWFYFFITVGLILLTFTFIRMRERAHRKRELELERGIQERTAEIFSKAEEIKMQKEIIEVKNKELTDSILYAQRIQQSILPNQEELLQGLPRHFIYFRPKDIVSGDFYWYSEQKDSVLWAVVDCTGHGVPGGFMSMLGSGLLNQIVNEEGILETDKILNQLRERVIYALKQTGGEGDNRDGMDIGICRYIPSAKKLQFSGANNPLYVIRDQELLEFNGDKQPIGIHAGEKKLFTVKEIQLKEGDQLYMSSDGFADQFGGEKGKKFRTANFEKLLLQISPSPIREQLSKLDLVFNNWKGDFEQLDDVCVVGVQIV